MFLRYFCPRCRLPCAPVSEFFVSSCPVPLFEQSPRAELYLENSGMVQKVQQPRLLTTGIGYCWKAKEQSCCTTNVLSGDHVLSNYEASGSAYTVEDDGSQDISEELFDSWIYDAAIGIGFQFPFSFPTEIDCGKEGGRARTASGKVARTSKQDKAV
ncbi:hypothetical protein OPV22_023088 [Ensete ventricosum]|uniref:Uncharacterized protein n=1 Tax=Ensete ventricosum TaxID=4639 RepID=A0AAV8PCE4_ENSVE|nr:hypothetical protein OPV22_023088 [Ensete ventricosum]